MNSANPLGPVQLDETRKAAPMLGLELVILDARNAAELSERLRTLNRRSVDGVLVAPDPLFQMHKSLIAAAVHRAKLPGMFPYKEYLDDGTLSSYGPDLRELSYRMAVYVDKILKGAKPSDLPIEQVPSISSSSTCGRLAHLASRCRRSFCIVPMRSFGSMTPSAGLPASSHCAACVQTATNKSVMEHWKLSQELAAQLEARGAETLHPFRA